MSNTVLRLSLLANGFHPIPILNGTKRPALKNWNKDEGYPTKEDILTWEAKYPTATGTGVLCGKVVAVDIDVLDPDLSTKIKNAIFDLMGTSAPERQGNKPKTCLLFRNRTPITKKSTYRFGTVFSKNHQVEVLGKGQQLIVDHIHPVTNQPYVWPSNNLKELKFDDLPEITPEQIDQILAVSENLFREAGLISDKKEEIQEMYEITSFKNDEYPALTAEDIEDILAFYPNSDLPYDDWIRVALCLNSWGGEKGREIFENWSAQSSKNNSEFTSIKYGQCANPSSVTIASLIYLAKQNGFQFKQKSSNKQNNQIDGKTKIKMYEGKTHETLNEFEKVMRASLLEFYRFNGQLVEVLKDDQK